jgi:hypothetical protein
MMANSWRVFWKYLAKVFHDTQSSETYLAKKSFDDWWLADSVYYASQNLENYFEISRQNFLWW